VQVQVIHSLPAIRPGIGYHAIAILLESLAPGDRCSEREKVAEHRSVVG
jgi:hypothetical protein